MAAIIGPIVTYHQVAAADVFFRAADFRDAAYIVTHLFSGFAGAFEQIVAIGSAPGRNFWVAAGSYAVVEWVEFARRRGPRQGFLSEVPRWTRWALCSGAAASAVLAMLLFLARHTPGNPFVYAIF